MSKIFQSKFLLVTSVLLFLLLTACSGSVLSETNPPGDGSPDESFQTVSQAATPMPSAYEIAIKAMEEQKSLETLNNNTNQPTGNTDEDQPSNSPLRAVAPGQDNPGNNLQLAQVPVDSGAAAENNDALQPTVKVDENIEIKPLIGFRAPDFNLHTLDGQMVSLSDLRGLPVVISYWTTWCVPCKEELPVLEQVAHEYGNDRIHIITINAIEQDVVDQVREMTSMIGLTLPVLLDQGDLFHTAYQQLFFPTNYFIDASGVIRDIKLGSTSETELRLKIEKLINNQS